MELTGSAAEETFLLELLNSTPIINDVQQDALDTAHHAQDWLRARGGTGTNAERQATRTARDVLQQLVRGEVPVAALAPLLDGVSYRPALSDDGVQWSPDAPAGRAVAARAVLAWDMVRRTRPGRLRACENPDCRLFLIDHSKPNKARWCSMAVCGNRMKARRHTERVRGRQH
jgi:predicted RNA-binding Zn ribbon-like protein